MSSSRRASGHSEEAKVGVGGSGANRSRAGSASSARSGASTGGSSGQARQSKQPSAPDGRSADGNVSCHFRYTGCHLLVIVSDGCDMLRQEHLGAALQFNETVASAADDGDGSRQAAALPPPPEDLQGRLKELDAEWTRKFIEHAMQQIAKGLLSWDTAQRACDLKPLETFLESSLARLATSSGGNGVLPSSEVALQYAEGSLAVEVLLNPTLHTLTQCLRNVLRSPTGAVQVIYAGATFEETGSWVLRDGAFSAYNFYELVQALDETVADIDCKAANGASKAEEAADNLSSSATVCSGHATIAEHLSCHDIVLHFHTERPGEWAVLPAVFASATLENVSSSMTSSLIVAELASGGSAGKGGSVAGAGRSAAAGLVRGSARSQVSRVSPASAAAAAAAANKRRRHLFHFDLNPADSADGVQGSAALIDYLGEALAKYYNGGGASLKKVMSRFATCADADLADSVGYIKLTRPTVYVFPGGQGDCALFGLDNGFTMLMDGGFLPAERSFWNFVRHLQRLDSVVVTHLGEDNLFGLKSLLENKLMRENWASFRAPAIGYLFCNDQFSQPSSSELAQLNTNALPDISTFSLTGLTASFFSTLGKLNIEPLACIRNIDSLNCTCPSIGSSTGKSGRASGGGSVVSSRSSDRPLPVTLYHKVGHGTLYLYVLSPTLEGITRPQAPMGGEGSGAVPASATIPEADQQSICSLLVWRPHDADEKITRIFVPGNATQADIVDGFETLLAMAKVDSRVRSRYAPKPKNADGSEGGSGGGTATIESVELELLLGKPYPVTGGDVETALRDREASKAVKFRPSAPGLPLHGYRRSASVAPKVVARRQQVAVGATTRGGKSGRTTPSVAGSRQRSTTPSSRFSRFRSVSPTPRVDTGRSGVAPPALMGSRPKEGAGFGSGFGGARGVTIHQPVPPPSPAAAPPTAAKAVTGSSSTTAYRSYRAPDETNKTHTENVTKNHPTAMSTGGRLHLKAPAKDTASRPPSSASSADRGAAAAAAAATNVAAAAARPPLPVVVHAKQPQHQPPTTAAKPTATAAKEGRGVLPAISSKTPADTRPPPQNVPTGTLSILERKQQLMQSGKVFKSAKEFRKSNAEQATNKEKKPDEAVSEDAKKTEQSTPRPVPRKVKRPIPLPPESDQKKVDEAKTVGVIATAGVAVAGAAAIAAATTGLAVSDETNAEKTSEELKSENEISQSEVVHTDTDQMTTSLIVDDEADKDTGLKVLEYEDVEDVSIRSTTDEEVMKITTRMDAEREAALTQESATVKAETGGEVSLSMSSSPAVDSLATGVEDDDEEERDEHSARTVTPDINDDDTNKEAKEEMPNQVNEGTIKEIKEEMKEEVKEKVKEETKEGVKEEVKYEVKDEVLNATDNKLKENVSEELKEELPEKVKEEDQEEVINKTDELSKEEVNSEAKENIATATEEPSKFAIEIVAKAQPDASDVDQSTTKLEQTTLDALAPVDYDVDVIAPPPPTPARPGSEVAEIVDADESMLEPLSVDQMNVSTFESHDKDADDDDDKGDDKNEMKKGVDPEEDTVSLQTKEEVEIKFSESPSLTSTLHPESEALNPLSTEHELLPVGQSAATLTTSVSENSSLLAKDLDVQLESSISEADLLAGSSMIAQPEAESEGTLFSTTEDQPSTTITAESLETETLPSEAVSVFRKDSEATIVGGSALALTPSPDDESSEKLKAESEPISPQLSKDKLPFSDVESAEAVQENEEKATVTVAEARDTESAVPIMFESEDLQGDKDAHSNNRVDTETESILTASKMSTEVDRKDDDDKDAESLNTAEQQPHENSSVTKAAEKKDLVESPNENADTNIFATKKVLFTEMENDFKSESESKQDTAALSLAQELIDAAKTELETAKEKSSFDSQTSVEIGKDKSEFETHLEESTNEAKNVDPITDNFDNVLSKSEIIVENDEVKKLVSVDTSEDVNAQPTENADAQLVETEIPVKPLIPDSDAETADISKIITDATGVTVDKPVKEADLTETVAKIESELPNTSEMKRNEIAVEFSLPESEVIATEKAVIADDKAVNESTTGDDNGDTQFGDNRDKQVPIKEEELLEEKTNITVLQSSQLSENDVENSVIEHEELKKDLQEEILKPDTTTGDGDKIAQHEEVIAKESTIDSQTVIVEKAVVDQLSKEMDADFSKSVFQETVKENEKDSESVKNLQSGDYFDKVVAEKEESLKETLTEVENQNEKPQNDVQQKPTSMVTDMLESIPSSDNLSISTNDSTDYFDRLVDDKKASEAPIGETIAEIENKNVFYEDKLDKKEKVIELDATILSTTLVETEQSSTESQHNEPENDIFPIETSTTLSVEPIKNDNNAATGILDDLTAGEQSAKENTVEAVAIDAVESKTLVTQFKSDDDLYGKEVKEENELLVDNSLTVAAEKTNDNKVASVKNDAELNVTSNAFIAHESSSFAIDGDAHVNKDDLDELPLAEKVETGPKFDTEKLENKSETNLQNEQRTLPQTQQKDILSDNKKEISENKTAEPSSPLLVAVVSGASSSSEQENQLLESKDVETQQQETLFSSAVVGTEKVDEKSSIDLQNISTTDSINLESETSSNVGDHKILNENDNQMNVNDHQSSSDGKPEGNLTLATGSITGEPEHLPSTITFANTQTAEIDNKIEDESNKVDSSNLDVTQTGDEPFGHLKESQILSSNNDELANDSEFADKTETLTTSSMDVAQKEPTVAETPTSSLPGNDHHQLDSVSEIINEPDSEKEDAASSADEREQQVSSPFEIIDESQITTEKVEPTEASGGFDQVLQQTNETENAPLASSPLVQTPLSSTSADDLSSPKTEQELMPKSPVITEIYPESRKESAVSLGDFDLEHRATLQSLDAENASVDKKSRKSVDFAMDNSGKKLKTVDMPPLTRRSDSDFDRAFLASADIDPDEDEFSPTSADESNDDLVEMITAEASKMIPNESIENDSPQKTPTSKLEAYFTSELVKPLEKVAEEVRSFDQSDDTGFVLSDKDDTKNLFEFVNREDIGDVDVDENKNHLVSEQKLQSEEKTAILHEDIFEKDVSKALQPIETELTVQSVVAEPIVEAAMPDVDNAEKLSLDSLAEDKTADSLKNVQFKNDDKVFDETNKLNEAAEKIDTAVKTESDEHQEKPKEVIMPIDGSDASEFLLSDKKFDNSIDNKAEEIALANIDESPTANDSQISPVNNISDVEKKHDQQEKKLINEKTEAVLEEKESVNKQFSDTEMTLQSKNADLKDASDLFSNIIQKDGNAQLHVDVTEKEEQFAEPDFKKESTGNADKIVDSTETDLLSNKSLEVSPINLEDNNNVFDEKKFSTTTDVLSNDDKLPTTVDTAKLTDKLPTGAINQAQLEPEADKVTKVEIEQYELVQNQLTENIVDTDTKSHRDDQNDSKLSDKDKSTISVDNEFEKTSLENNADTATSEHNQKLHLQESLEKMSIHSDEDKNVNEPTSKLETFKFEATHTGKDKANDDSEPVSPLVKADFTTYGASKPNVDSSTDDVALQSSFDATDAKSSASKLELLSSSETSADSQTLNSQTNVAAVDDKIDSNLALESDANNDAENSLTDKSENPPAKVVPSTVDLQTLLGICDVENDKDKQQQTATEDVDISHSAMAPTEKMLLETSSEVALPLEGSSDLLKEPTQNIQTESDYKQEVLVTEVDAEKAAQILARSSDHLVMKQEESTAILEKTQLSQSKTDDSSTTITETDTPDVVSSKEILQTDRENSANDMQLKSLKNDDDSATTFVTTENDKEEHLKDDINIALKIKDENEVGNGLQTSMTVSNDGEIQTKSDVFADSTTLKSSDSTPFEIEKAAMNVKTSVHQIEVTDKKEEFKTSDNLLTTETENKIEKVDGNIELANINTASQVKNDEIGSTNIVDAADSSIDKSENHQTTTQLSSLSSVESKKENNQTNVDEGDIEELEPISIPEPYEIATAIIEMVNGKVTEIQQNEKLAEINRKEELEIIEQIKNKSSDVKEALTSEKEALQRENTEQKVLGVADTEFTTQHQNIVLLESKPVNENKTSNFNILPETTAENTNVDKKETSVEISKITQERHENTQNDVHKNRSFDNVQSIEGFSDIDSDTLTQKPIFTTRQISSSSSTADKYRVQESEDGLDSFEDQDQSGHYQMVTDEVLKPDVNFDFMPLTAEVVHLPESDVELSLKTNEDDEADSLKTTIDISKMTDIVPVTESKDLNIDSQKVPLSPISLKNASQNEKEQDNLQTSQLSVSETEVTEIDKNYKNGKVDQNATTESVAPQVESMQSKTEMAFITTETMGKNEKYDGEKSKASSELEDATSAKQIDRTLAQFTALSDNTMGEIRAISEQELPKNGQSNELIKTESVESGELDKEVEEKLPSFEEAIKLPPTLHELASQPQQTSSTTLTITTFASSSTTSTPTVTTESLTGETLTSSTGGGGTLTESISTSSSSYYVEPHGSSGLLIQRSGEEFGTIGPDDDLSSNSSSSWAAEGGGDEEKVHFTHEFSGTGDHQSTISVTPTLTGRETAEDYDLSTQSDIVTPTKQTTTTTMSVLLSSEADSTEKEVGTLSSKDIQVSSPVTSTTTTTTMTATIDHPMTGNGTTTHSNVGISTTTSTDSGNKPPHSSDFDVDRDWGRPLGLPSPVPPPTHMTAKLPPLPPSSTPSGVRSRPRTPDRRSSIGSNSTSATTAAALATAPNGGHSTGSQSHQHPVYVELAYVPGHGRRGYVDETFFKKVRARYYVFSGVTPSREVFEALLAAKATWEPANLYVTVIPTYESEALLSWIADNQSRLTELRIDVTPAASRCSINLADGGSGAGSAGEESCAAYKVEL